MDEISEHEHFIMETAAYQAVDFDAWVRSAVKLNEAHEEGWTWAERELYSFTALFCSH